MQTIDVTEVAGPKQTVTIVSMPVVSDAACEALATLIREKQQPVVVQMDDERWEWTTGASDRDLVEIVRAGEQDKLSAHLANTVVARRFTMRDGVIVDGEYLRAHDTAEGEGLPFVLGGRSQTISFQRAWRLTTFWSRARLFFWFAFGLMRAPFRSVSESRSHQDVLDDQSKHFARRHLIAHHSYVNEASDFFVDQLRRQPEDVVALVKPECAERIERALASDDVLEVISTAPARSLISRALPWVISACVVTAFILGFVFMDYEKMQHAVLAWVLINGSLAGLGVALSGGHLLTVVATALSAPIVSLNPAVGAGMVGAFVEAWVRPPTIEEIQGVGDSIARWSGWWSNGLARVMLIFFLANAFSTIGSFTALAWFPSF